MLQKVGNPCFKQGIFDSVLRVFYGYRRAVKDQKSMAKTKQEM